MEIFMLCKQTERCLDDRQQHSHTDPATIYGLLSKMGARHRPHILGIMLFLCMNLTFVSFYLHSFLGVGVVHIKTDYLDISY